MNISAKTEYACIAMLELAIQNDSGQPVQVRRIAEAHGIPSRFLVQILLQLKGAGLVTSTRGVSGGYRLARHPRDITLRQVMNVIDGASDRLASSATVETLVSRVLLDTWQEASDVLRQTLDSITLANLAEKARGPAEDMYFI